MSHFDWVGLGTGLGPMGRPDGEAYSLCHVYKSMVKSPQAFGCSIRKSSLWTALYFFLGTSRECHC